MGFRVQRHDSMYMLLPLVMVCLFSLLLGLNRGERRSCRKLSSLIYVLHPWCIVLVRGGAEVLGLEGPLVENSMGHFLGRAGLQRGGVLGAVAGLEQTATETLQ